MVQQVIDELRNNHGFDYRASIEEYEWKEATKGFFDSDTLEGRIRALLKSQYIRLGTMVKLAYNGFDEAKDMPYNPQPVMDLMTNSVQNELKDNYIRVIGASEEIFLKSLPDLSAAEEGIKNLLAEIKKEDEDNQARDEAFEKKVSKTSKS